MEGMAQIGVIAQEVLEQFPEAVTTDDDPLEGNDIMSVNYGMLTAPLIEAFKEQAKELDDLRIRMAQLEQKMHLLTR